MEKLFFPDILDLRSWSGTCIPCRHDLRKLGVLEVVFYEVLLLALGEKLVTSGLGRTCASPTDSDTRRSHDSFILPKVLAR